MKDDCGWGTAFIGPIPAIVVGTVLLLGVFAAVLVVAARRPDRLTLLVALAVLALAFFVVPTRVHERYGYPFFALAVILSAISLRWLAAYLVLSIATFANMYVVLTTIYSDNPSIEDWLGIGPAIRSEAGVTVVVAAAPRRVRLGAAPAPAGGPGPARPTSSTPRRSSRRPTIRCRARPPPGSRRPRAAGARVDAPAAVGRWPPRPR